MGFPYWDIDERLAFDIRYQNPDRKLSKKQCLEMMQEYGEEQYVSPEYFKLAIAHCVYNEEKMLMECLENDLIINDVDIIHILDGAWEGYGEKEVNSTDRTKEIVDKFRKKIEEHKLEIEVIFEENPNGRLWKNESEKRNYQFKAIDKACKNTAHYTFIKDADELFHLTTGQKTVWLKRDLGSFYNLDHDLGCVRVYPYQFKQGLTEPRLFPSSKDYHFHSDRPRLIHDDKHTPVIDYHPPTFNMYGSNEVKFIPDTIVIIDKPQFRDDDRISQKNKYTDVIDTAVKSFQEGIGCKYKIREKKEILMGTEEAKKFQHERPSTKK